MPTVDVVEESYLRAPAARVAAILHEPTRWARWWPGLSTTVFMDRAEQGIRWNVTGELTGSMEYWIEACPEPLGGVILHYYLRAEPGAGAATADPDRWAVRAKAISFGLKDHLEGCAG